MKILLAGGGTAGHVTPAIAIGEIIKNNIAGATVAYAGRTDGIENQAYLASGDDLYTVDVCGLNRKLSVKSIKSIFKLIKSSRSAKRIIKKFDPDIIIGTGGYVSFPFLLAGQRLGIKTVIHESNVSPGLVTRLLGGRCDTVLLSLEGAKKHLKNTKNTVVVGTPTRLDFGRISHSDARRKLGIHQKEILIVSFGGSLGADVMNDTIAELIIKYTSKEHRIRHIHATGKRHYEEMKQKYKDLFIGCHNAKILPYIDDMPTVLMAADIAITRSGAITVSELCRCGTPSILIPSPNVSGNHQYFNAEYMQERGASILIEEKDLSSDRLNDTIEALISSPERLKKASESALNAHTKNTEAAILKIIRSLVE